MIESQIILRVYGRLWSGPRACYQYNVATAPADDTAARRMAGDFESLLDYHVVQATHAYEPAGAGLLRRVDSYKTLRGWRNGFSNRKYDRAVNGN